jgi:hypothetical protein
LTLWCAGDPPSRGHVDAVAYFLRTSRTLEYLHLNSYRFNKDTLEAIIEGIHSNKSLTKLMIANSEFDLESTIQFQKILKPKNGMNTIRELLLGEVTFDQRPVGSVVSSILSPKQVGNDNGSKKDEIVSLDVLAMTGPMGNVECIYERLGNKAATIQLRCVLRKGGRLDLAGCDALAACLPKLIYLKELGILDDAAPALNSPVHKERLLRALKQNGSLHFLQFAPSWSDFLTDRDSRQLQLSMERNQLIPALVANPRLGDDDDDSKTERCLVPKLFAAAMLAPRTAPNSMLIGLLALGDTVGPGNGR